MIREDTRSRRVVIVADYLINPDSALYADLTGQCGSVVDVLVEDGWGIIKPPPHVLADSIGRPAVANIAGDAVDYKRHNYTVVILAVEGLPKGGVWLDLFEVAFAELGAPMPAVARLQLNSGGGVNADPAGVRATLAATTVADVLQPT